MAREFSAKARKAAIIARRRNNELRKKGLYPPIKRPKKDPNKEKGVSIPLDAIPGPSLKKPGGKKTGGKDRDLVIQLLFRIVHILEKMV